MNTQPEALRLADWLENEPGYDWNRNYCLAVAELRRLHEVNQMLVEAAEMALEALEHWMRIDTVEDMHIFETVAAPEAIAVLRKALESEPWDTTDMAHRAGGLSMEQDEIVPSDYSGVTGDYSGVTGDYMEQEPVAWIAERDQQVGWHLEKKKYVVFDHNLPVGTKLYTAPPKREWVGLTDEEREYLCGITPIEDEDRFAFVLAVEAKLKEKNTCSQ